MCCSALFIFYDYCPSTVERFTLRHLVAVFAVLIRSSRQRVRIILKFTSPVSNFEVILSKSFKPSSHLSFRILYMKEPCNGYVISSNQEFASIQIFVEMFNSPDNCQQLLPRGTVVLFGFGKYAAEVLDDSFFFFNVFKAASDSAVQLIETSNSSACAEKQQYQQTSWQTL